MNHITKIAARNLKGRCFDYDLAPVTIVCGPSFSGKTGVLDAIRLGLLGYHPALGKRAGDTFRLCSGSVLGVTLERATLSMIGEPSGQRIDRSWTREGGSVRVGTDLPTMLPALSLDIREFFSLTAAQRLNYIFGRVSPELTKLTPQGLAARVRGIAVGRPEHIRTDVENILKSYLEDDEEPTPQEFAEALHKAFATARKEALAAARASEGSATTAALTGQFGAFPARNCAAELAMAREGLSSVILEHDRAQNVIEARKSLLAQLERMPNLPPPAGALDEAKRRLSDLEAQQTKLGSSKIDAKIVAAARKASSALEGARADTRDNLDKATKIREDIEGLKAEKCCPHCMASAPGWRKKIEGHLTEELDSLLLVRHGLVKREKELAKELEAASKAEQAEFARVQKVGNMGAQIAQAHEDLADLLARVDVQKDRAQLQARLTELGEPAPIDLLLATMAKARERVEELNATHTRWIAEQAQVNARNRAAELLEKTRELAAVYGAVVEEIQAAQQEAIARAVGTVMEAANRFTDGILDRPLEYRNGEFGYEDETGTWVSHETFSGTEKAITYAGLAVALTLGAPFRLVLIDELGIMDELVRVRVVERMIELVDKGHIDQFIGCDVRSSKWWSQLLGASRELRKKTPSTAMIDVA